MKTSNPKARTARRFWSLLLSLVMVLALLPTAALAYGTDPVSIQTGLPFTVKATDEADNPLAGIEIELWKKDWQSSGEIRPVASATTDASGIATFDGRIPEGEYVLWQETLGFPANYHRDPYEYPVTVAADGATPDGPVMTFKNPSIMYDLTIPVEKIVTVVGEQGPAPTEFWFQLWRMGDDGVLEELLDAQSLTADADGKTVDLTFSFLKSKYTAGTKLCLVEGSDYAAGWTYSEEKYGIHSANITIMSFGDPEPQLDENGRYHELFGQIKIEKLDADGQPSGAVEKASFTNSYTEGRYEIPFTKTVKLGGNTAPGRQSFELEIFNPGNSGMEDFDHLYTATVDTSGAGSYDGKLIISGPANEVEGLVCEGFYVKEKNTGTANWTYSDAVWHVEPDGYDNNQERIFQIYPTTLEHSENGDYYVDAETPVNQMAFENTYTYNTSSDGSSSATITVKKTDGAGSPLAGAVFALNNSRGDAVYEATSNSSGVARFTDVGSGSYILVEQTAPEGYVKSEKRYELTVADSRVTMGQTSYTPVTFVNYKEVELNREDHYTFLVGYTDGTFGPERNMTRSEVTVMFARLLTEQIEADKTYSNTFNDVPESHWAADYIGYMQQFGIIAGYPDGSFRPDAPVARAEFAAIASRFEKLTAGTKSFADVPADHWAAKYINFAATRGWVSGYTDGTFRPENPITRAEVAAVTCRLLERTADQDYIRSHLDQLRTFRDMPESHWSYWYAMEAANGHDYTKTESGETWNQLHP